NGTSQEEDNPSTYVTILGPDGKPRDTYMRTTMRLFPGVAPINVPQILVYDGKYYLLQLRYKRTYVPYSLTLLNFNHGRYTGTDVAKDFSSSVRLVDPTQNENREVRIWMNHPLRYAGQTFYQQSFLPGDKTTILQVVRNPGWLIPYISC